MFPLSSLSPRIPIDFTNPQASLQATTSRAHHVQPSAWPFDRLYNTACPRTSLSLSKTYLAGSASSRSRTTDTNQLHCTTRTGSSLMAPRGLSLAKFLISFIDAVAAMRRWVEEGCWCSFGGAINIYLEANVCWSCLDDSSQIQVRITQV
jgi:hypothetical protein